MVVHSSMKERPKSSLELNLISDSLPRLGKDGSPSKDSTEPQRAIMKLKSVHKCPRLNRCRAWYPPAIYSSSASLPALISQPRRPQVKAVTRLGRVCLPSVGDWSDFTSWPLPKRWMLLELPSFRCGTHPQ